MKMVKYMTNTSFPSGPEYDEGMSIFDNGGKGSNCRATI
jgi:hypothetical protein